MFLCLSFSGTSFSIFLFLHFLGFEQNLSFKGPCSALAVTYPCRFGLPGAVWRQRAHFAFPIWVSRRIWRLQPSSLVPPGAKCTACHRETRHSVCSDPLSAWCGEQYTQLPPRRFRSTVNGVIIKQVTVEMLLNHCIHLLECRISIPVMFPNAVLQVHSNTYKPSTFWHSQ